MSTKVKIMFLIDKYVDPYAGTEKQLLNLVNNLDRNIYEPTLTTLRSSDYDLSKELKCNLRILDIKKVIAFSTLIKVFKFVRYLRNKNYKIVHIYFNDASIFMPIFLKISGLKVIISRRDMGYWYSKSILFILKLNSYFVDAAVVNCQAVKKVINENENIALDKIYVIYNGYRKELNPIDNEINRYLESLKNGKRIIGIVANIKPIKRIEDLIYAFSDVQKEVGDCILLIVGSGDAAPLEEIACNLGIYEDIIFLGQQRNVEDIIRYFDISVLCSESEGFSNSIMEYMYCNKPVICTKAGGNEELVEDGVNGLTYKVGDTEALKNHILFLLNNHVAYENMSKNTVRMISEKCDLTTMVSKHDDMYSKIL